MYCLHHRPTVMLVTGHNNGLAFLYTCSSRRSCYFILKERYYNLLEYGGHCCLQILTVRTQFPEPHLAKETSQLKKKAIRPPGCSGTRCTSKVTLPECRSDRRTIGVLFSFGKKDGQKRFIHNMFSFYLSQLKCIKKLYQCEYREEQTTEQIFLGELPKVTQDSDTALSGHQKSCSKCYRVWSVVG